MHQGVKGLVSTSIFIGWLVTRGLMVGHKLIIAVGHYDRVEVLHCGVSFDM